jgi:transposase
MAMGTRKGQEQQEEMWIPQASLAKGASHPFYQRLNQLLEESRLDEFVEGRCRRFYAEKRGRPSLPPGRYFRLLLIGYFEGIDAEGGIAWRANDSLALRGFLRVALDEAPPDHSTISRTRRLIDVETHGEVFTWVLGVLAEKGLLKGQTLGVDSTTLEANAALGTMVRRDTGEGYEEFLRRLAQASGIKTPTREELARLDRKRAHKGSNEDWEHRHDPDARITKMKDGRTHLAHQVEHAVDFSSGAVVAVTLQPADTGDTATGARDGVRSRRTDRDGRGRGEGRGSESARAEGSGPRQGLSQQRNDGGVGRLAGAQLLFGAGPRAAALGGEEGRTSRGVRQPAADSGRTREEVIAAAGREGGTELCPLL